MASEGDKQGKEAVKPTGRPKSAGGRGGTTSRSAASSPSRASGSATRSSRPAGRAATKPGDKQASSKAAGKPAAKPSGRSSKAPAQPAKGDRSTKAASRAVKTEETAETGAGVNREMKRMMKRREGAADRLRRAPTAPSRKRTKPLTFLKEVRGELGRVAWPSRPEVITYSMVVLVTVIFFMVVIAGIDYVALRGVLFLIDRGGR